MHTNIQNSVVFAEFFDEQPQALIWLKPVWHEDSITDFIYSYSNAEGLKYLNLKKEWLNNISIFTTPSLTDEMRGKIFKEMVNVYETGITSETQVYNPIIKRHAKVFRSKFQKGILVLIQDGTKERNAIDQLEKQTKELEYQKSFSNSILDASANGIFALEAIRNENDEIIDLQILKINKAFTKIIGRTAEEVEGKSYLALFPGSKQAGTFDLNCRVITTGIGERKEMFYKGDGLDAWYDVSLVKWGANGLVVTFSNITDRKQAEIEREQQNQLVQSMFNAAFHGKALLEPVYENRVIVDFKVLASNPSTEAQIGIKPESAIGKLLSEILPHYKKEGFFDFYVKVLQSGEPERTEHCYQDENLSAWFDIYAAPVNNGIVVSFSNITERKQEAIKIQQQKNLLDAILAHSPSGISVTQVIRDERNNVIDGRTILANEAAIRYVGIPEDLYLSKTAKELDPHIFESPLYQLILNTLQTGKPFHTQYYLEPYKRWLELSVAKMDDEHLINVFTDVTATKEVQIQVEEFANTLQKFINTSQSGMSLFKPVINSRGELVDFIFGISNIAWAAYAGQTPEAITGELVSKWFPAYLQNGLFEQYKKTHQTGETIRAEWHYVGDNIDAWLDIMSTKMEDGVLITLTDFTKVKQLQLQLEKYVDDLKHSNANLQEFAYAASHDLQEPIRKIQLFSEKLKVKYSDKLDKDGVDVLERIAHATVRMNQLINDLLSYSRITEQRKAVTEIDLNVLLQEVKSDLDTLIQEKQAVIKVDGLPKISADKNQMRQVFHNLMSNALKYSKQDINPEIRITYSILPGQAINNVSAAPKQMYHVIEFEDNGIGFEQKYAEDIFKIFQRLHSRKEYPGTGVGLAMVQKAIQNHGGRIFATAEPGEGAKFTIVLPAS